jgi:hypothetical protein
MRDEELLEQLRESVRRLGENPRELWEKLLREGIIDSIGNVLVRMPEPPPKKRGTNAPKGADGKRSAADGRAVLCTS